LDFKSKSKIQFRDPERTEPVLRRRRPSRTDLLHDVLRREAEMSHRQPVGRLREDLVAELDALRRQLGLPALAGVLAVLIERSLHDPELARVKRSVVSEVSRVLRQRLHDGIGAGALPPALDVDLAIARLLGPILYRRLASGESLSRPVVVAVVDAFLLQDDVAPRREAGTKATGLWKMSSARTGIVALAPNLLGSGRGCRGGCESVCWN
jgi:hypothetical protein